jgi:choice-of-anchor B domain-containing protein
VNPRFHRLAQALAATWAAVVCLAAGVTEASAAPVSKRVQLLAHLNNYSRYSACCSYVHHDGREYAVLGCETGTSIVNVTNPGAPYEVAFIPGISSFWREMKQYRTWLYISTEATGGGVQIVRMTDPEHPVLATTYIGTFNHEHTVTVDTTRALLILNGTRQNSNQTGMHILSLANPEAPVDIGMYNFDYVHDSWMRGTRLHAFCINTGVVRIFDTTDPTFPDEQVAWNYPNSKSHSGETSKDGRYLFVCDEINYSTLKVFDLDDLQAHPMLWETTVNPLTIVHNVHVKQDTAFVSWYTEGVRLFDVTDPTLPAEWGYYDTYPGFSGGFHGVWEVAPFFPSGTFIASDIETGLYVFRATPDYGTVKVRVRNGASAPIQGADIVDVNAPDEAAVTSLTGGARIALSTGVHDLRISKFGYAPKNVFANVTVGSQDSFVVVLSPLATTALAGSVRRDGDAAAIADAVIEAEDAPLEATSGITGAYSIPGTPRGVYSLRCYRPGYATAERVTAMEPGVARSIDWKLMRAAWYDSCDTDKGWSLTDPTDNSVFAGRWQRVIPNGTTGQNAPGMPGSRGSASPVSSSGGGPSPTAQHDEPAEGMLPVGPVAPGTDATPGAGTGWCFVTGNGPVGADPTAYDVDQGKTTLTTPALDLSAMTEPTLSWQRWYHMNTPGEPDSMLIQISGDGVNWVTMLSLIESHPEWHLDVVRVKDYITPTATVRVRFIAQDQPIPTDGTLEAAVDDFAAYDAALTPTTVDGPPAPDNAPPVALEAPRPNPSARATDVVLRLHDAGPATVAVYDVNGRRVATLFEGEAPAGPLSLRWSGRDVRGREVGSGVYWIRADAAGERLTRRMVRVK